MAIDENQTSQEKANETQSVSLSSAKWLEEVKASQAWMAKWHEQGRKIVKRFLDKRDSEGENKNKINIFTSNTQILIATLYSRFPKPLVAREFDDENDDIARVASEALERMLKIRARDDFDTGMRFVVQDRLVPGLGTLWLRYDAKTEQIEIPAVIDPLGNVIEPAGTGEQLVDECVCTDYVFWEDFLMSPARTWPEVRWVGRSVKMTRPDVEKRFGAEIAKLLSYKKGSSAKETNQSTGIEPEGDIVEYAIIYEIWCKKSKKVYWVSTGFDFVLDQKDDPLELSAFFPCPRPMMALTSTSNLIPRPDFLLVQDQYDELDMVNNRITLLERAIKAVGVYDGTNMDIERIFTEGVDNKILPSRSFREFADRGGFKGSMDWVPIEMFVNALDKLRQYRQDLISQIYELTGISDIMRGATKASETAAAQQLKAQYGSVKLQFLQMEVAAFVEDALQIKAEIICKKFQPDTIKKHAALEQLSEPDMVDPAIELLKSRDWEYRVEVHADSMAVPEFNAERDARFQFIRATAEMITGATPMIEKDPSTGIAILQMIKWAAASFRTGKTIEGYLDKTILAIENAAKAPKEPPPPDPSIQTAEIKAKVDVENNMRDNETKLRIAFESEQAENIRAEKKIQSENARAESERGLKMNERAEDRADRESERNMKAVEARAPAIDIQAIVEPVREAAQAQMESTQSMVQAIAELAKSMNQPRRKVPVRDKNGSIVRVDEIPFKDE
jgi:hypothetical protein